jgi:hypothetical protein
MGRHRLLIARWSCSTMLFRYWRLRHQDVLPASVLSTKPTQSPVTLLMPIQGDLTRPSRRAGPNRFTEKSHRRSDSARGLEQRLDRLSLLVDGPVQVARPWPGLDVRLIHAPGRADGLRPPVPPRLVFRYVPMDPAHDRRVADVYASLGHKSDEIAVAQAVGKIPAHAALDDFTRESPTPVYRIAFNGLRHGKLRAKPAGYHDPAANAPEPPRPQSHPGTFLAHPI